MEIRASYIAVGIFTLSLLLGIFAFTLWLAKSDKTIAMNNYDISFTDSVTGLAVNSDVLFSGIRVGSVSEITISDKTPGAVRVRIAINAFTPVRANSQATLESRGLTGVVVISISGGTAESPLNIPSEGEVGIIDYKPSPLAAVMANVPNTIEATNQILYQLNQMLSPENVQAFSTTMQSLAKVSQALAKRSDDIEQILANSQKVTHELASLIATANAVLDVDVKKTSSALRDAAQRVNSTLASVEPNVRRFSSEGLTEIKTLLGEVQQLASTLSRITQKFESSPGQFLFGTQVKEYQP